MIIYLLFSISAFMFRSNNTPAMLDLFSGLFTNSSDYLRSLLAVNGSDWIVSGMELVQSENHFF